MWKYCMWCWMRSAVVKCGDYCWELAIHCGLKCGLKWRIMHYSCGSKCGLKWGIIHWSCGLSCIIAYAFHFMCWHYYKMLLRESDVLEMEWKLKWDLENKLLNYEVMIISFMWDLQVCCDLTCKNKNVSFLLQDKSCELIVGFSKYGNQKRENDFLCELHISLWVWVIFSFFSGPCHCECEKSWLWTSAPPFYARWIRNSPSGYSVVRFLAQDLQSPRWLTVWVNYGIGPIIGLCVDLWCGRHVSQLSSGLEYWVFCVRV